MGFKLKGKSNRNWGGARPGSGPKKRPVTVVTAPAETWPAGPLTASVGTVDGLAQLYSRGAMLTLAALAERGANELIRVRAAARLIDIAAQLGALGRPRRH